MWECPKCHVLLNDGFQLCFHCHTPKEQGRILSENPPKESFSPPKNALRLPPESYPPPSIYGELSVSSIASARFGYLKLVLTVHLEGPFEGANLCGFYEIRCEKAWDWEIKPPNPNRIEGVPMIEFYEKHFMLPSPGAQGVPSGDGEVFEPPLNLKLMRIDQSYIVAETFSIHPTSLPKDAFLTD